MEVGATAAVQAIATAVHDALAGRPPRPFDVTVYDPERRRFHAHLRTYAERQARSCVVVLADESAEADLKRRTLTDVVGIYWHFMDGLWVFLFLLLLLWR